MTDFLDAEDTIPTDGALNHILGLLTEKTSSSHTGLKVELGASEVHSVSWERSNGAMVNPESDFSEMTLASKWNKVHDFANPSYPDGAADIGKILGKTLSLPISLDTGFVNFEGKVAIVTGAASG